MRNTGVDESERRAYVALSQIPGLGDIGIARLVSDNESADHALRTHVPSVQAIARAAADALIADVDRIGARLITRDSAAYPSRLLELHDPPTVLFTQGQLFAADPPAVAIVGTRQASSYGVRVARAIATACAKAGATIISGLAKGIDGAAHEAALAAGGRTVAVLGTGLDVHYPRSHRALQTAIAQHGLLVSELRPGNTGHSGTFPRRNRIIAALADVTVVIEAGIGSGALITADCAIELGRTIACVPNAIDVPSAFGSNALLKRNAEPVLSPEDVLALLELRATPTVGPALDGAAADCWSAITAGAQNCASITLMTGRTAREVSTAVSMLELEGLLTVDANGAVRTAIDHVGA